MIQLLTKIALLLSGIFILISNVIKLFTPRSPEEIAFGIVLIFAGIKIDSWLTEYKLIKELKIKKTEESLFNEKNDD